MSTKFSIGFLRGKANLQPFEGTFCSVHLIHAQFHRYGSYTLKVSTCLFNMNNGCWQYYHERVKFENGFAPYHEVQWWDLVIEAHWKVVELRFLRLFLSQNGTLYDVFLEHSLQTEREVELATQCFDPRRLVH